MASRYGATQAAAAAAPAPSSLTPPALLVLGVVTTEKWAVERITRLRAFYSTWNGTALVKFILDEQWLQRERARQKILDTAAHDDLLGVPTMSELPQRHCAHKMVGWWRAASRWPAAYYVKTDDDAAVDLAQLVPLLRSPSMPRTRAYAGVVRYSSLNESSLLGVCWAPGAGGALKLRQRRAECVGAYGPFPFAEGPLIVLSVDVQAWLAPRLAIDVRQRCHFEDLLLGQELSRHPSLHLVNLDRLVGRSNVIAGKQQGGGWVGATGILAHWTRTDEHFRRAIAGFSRATAAKATTFALAASATWSPISVAPALECSLWRGSYTDLTAYPCCNNWTLCVPPPSKPFRAASILRTAARRSRRGKASRVSRVAT